MFTLRYWQKATRNLLDLPKSYACPIVHSERKFSIKACYTVNEFVIIQASHLKSDTLSKIVKFYGTYILF